MKQILINSKFNYHRTMHYTNVSYIVVVVMHYIYVIIFAACGVNGALYTILACVTGFPCCYSCFYRSKMREQYMLKASPCGDCLVHCFCESCALCQEYRELKNRGFDMSIGNSLTLYFIYILCSY